MVVTKLWFRWSIAGSSLLKDDKRPRVIIMNHPSMFDPVMMVALILLMIVLAVTSIFLPGAGKGLAFYLKPNFAHMARAGIAKTIFAAMGQ